MPTNFKGRISAEEYAEEQEKAYQWHQMAVAQQMLRDARPIHVTGYSLLRFLLVCVFLAGALGVIVWMAFASRGQ